MLTICIFLLATQGGFAADAQAPGQPIQDRRLAAERDADAFNYLTMRLRVLKRGSAAEELKSEIVNQIEFSALSPRAVDLLRRTMMLCDRAVAGQAKAAFEVAGIEENERKTNAHSSAALTTTLLSAGTFGIGSLLPLLSALDSGGDSKSKKDALRAQSTAELGADISTLEFDLATWRGEIQASGSLEPREFVTPADYDQFLKSVALPTEDARIAGITAALESSPRLQPAALYLATNAWEKHEYASCSRYADQVIATAPRILRRDALRAYAFALKAHIALANKDYSGTVTNADLGLADAPAQPHLMCAKAYGLMGGGAHADALPLLEKAAVLSPDDGGIRYNLSCCQAVAKKDADAALASFRDSLAKGFSNVEHARADADLSLLRERFPDEFTNLTTLRLKVELVEGLLTAGHLVITNASSFPVEQLNVRFEFSATPAARTAPSRAVERTLTILHLVPTKTENLTLDSGIHAKFDALHVLAEGPQGRFEQTYTRKELQPQQQRK
jgi:hypothetical protein